MRESHENAVPRTAIRDDPPCRSPQRKGDVSPTVLRPRQMYSPALPRWQRLSESLCSLSTIAALVYCFFLVVVAVATTAHTRVQTGRVLMLTWDAAHATHRKGVEAVVDNVASIMTRNAIEAAALYAHGVYPVESNKTLSMLCGQLAMGDTNFRIRALSLVSIANRQYTACSHADRNDYSLETLSAVMSENGHFTGLYYVNPTSFTFYDPPRLRGRMDSSLTATQLINAFRAVIPTIDKTDAYLNGSLATLTTADLWVTASNQPNRLYFTLPLAMLGTTIPISAFIDFSDFAQTRIDGGTLLNKTLLTDPSVSTRAMVLINQSLSSGDPFVFSNNWMQEVVHSSTYSITVDTNTTYLQVSNINDPLMREAIKHVDLSKLQHTSYKNTAYFSYRGAPAIVTAWVYTNAFGLSLPIVVVSPHYAVAGPYIFIKNICTGMVVLAVVLLTALCYFAMDRYLARPLRRVTAAMDASVRRGVRQPVRGDACDAVQLAETRALTAAYNGAMVQLRVVDEFVPGGVQRVCGVPLLREHYLTIVTVRVRSWLACAGGAGGGAGLRSGSGGGCGVLDTDALLLRHQRDAGRGRLAAFASAVAEATTQLTSSGPFASAAALAAFVCAVRELCDARGGTVHRAAPDACVLHFARAVRGCAVRGSCAAEVERCASADARAAADFALALQQWVDAACGADASSMPDMRVLVDTGVFTCGAYRAPGSEQTLSVAFGSDADGAVGHVPALLGVRVAATEETAVRLRGADGAGGTGGTGSVRQLPVEVLETGRAELDGGEVTLYELLPGAVDGDAAWLLYARCCTDGFAAMVRGDYAGALRAYKEVAEISDLEPGLLPASLRREAASSDASGGAVSVQVQRLMRECEVRLRAGCTAGYRRERCVPLGVDAVLGGVFHAPAVAAAASTNDCPAASSSSCPHASSVGRRSRTASASAATVAPGATTAASSSSRRASRRSGGASVLAGREGCAGRRGAASPWRYVVGVNTASGRVRRAVGGRPAWIRDNCGLCWYLPRCVDGARGGEQWMQPCTALGSAGTLCTVTTLLLREGAGLFGTVLAGAPDGPMSDAVRSALPVWEATSTAHWVLKRLYERHLLHEHPNIQNPFGYSVSVEGCVLVLWEPSPGGSLRELSRLYAGLKLRTLFVLGCSITSALSFLHSQGLVHGALSLDTINVGSDGVCRVISRYTDYELDNKLFALPSTCYVSPAMVAGHSPTPACDMFCYGLACLEAVSCRPAWMWAPVAEGESPRGSEEELLAMMAAGGQAFSAAVVDGTVVPNVALLESSKLMRGFSEELKVLVRRMLAYDPLERPTSQEAFEGTLRELRLSGICVADVEAQSV